MTRLTCSLTALAAAALFSVLVVACGDGLDVEVTAPPATRTPVQAPLAPAALTDEGQAAAIAAIEASPQVLVQGGSAIVYFNEPATAATLTFGGKQYPMLSDGARWWAVVGVGAFSDAGAAPITIAYNPLDGSGQKAAAGSIAIVERDYPIENIELDEETSALLDQSVVNNEEALRATIFSGYTMMRLWDGLFQAPMTSGTSSTYGVARSYNSGPVSDYHGGTDFVGERGEPVYASAAGRVVFADSLQVRGQTVIIDHGVGVFTSYSHLSALNVAADEMVTAGQVIGALGSTGLVTGPHLHWEVVVRGVEVDGELWLDGSVSP